MTGTNGDDLVERVGRAIAAEFDKDDLPEGGWPQLTRDAAKAAVKASGLRALEAENERLREALRAANGEFRGWREAVRQALSQATDAQSLDRDGGGVR